MERRKIQSRENMKSSPDLSDEFSAYSKLIDKVLCGKNSVKSFKKPLSTRKPPNRISKSPQNRASVTYIASPSPNTQKGNIINKSRSTDFCTKSARNVLKMLKKNISSLLRRMKQRIDRVDTKEDYLTESELLFEQKEFNEIRQKAKALFFECNEILEGMADQYISDYSVCDGDLRSSTLPRLRHDGEIRKVLNDLLKRIRLTEKYCFGSLKANEFKENILENERGNFNFEKKKESRVTVQKLNNTVHFHRYNQAGNSEPNISSKNISATFRVNSLENSSLINSPKIKNPSSPNFSEILNHSPHKLNTPTPKTGKKPSIGFETSQRFERVENVLTKIMKKIEGLEEKTKELGSKKENFFQYQMQETRVSCKRESSKERTIRKPKAFNKNFTSDGYQKKRKLKNNETDQGKIVRGEAVVGEFNANVEFKKIESESNIPTFPANIHKNNVYLERSPLSVKSKNFEQKNSGKKIEKNLREKSQDFDKIKSQECMKRTVLAPICNPSTFHKKPKIEGAVFISKENSEIRNRPINVLKINKNTISFNSLPDEDFPVIRVSNNPIDIPSTEREERVKILLKLRRVLKGIKIFTKKSISQTNSEEILQQQIHQTQRAIQEFLTFYSFASEEDKKILENIRAFIKNMDKASELLKQSCLFDGEAKNSFIFGIFNLIDKAGFSILDCIEKLKYQYLDLLPKSETERIMEYFYDEGKKFETDQEIKKIFLRNSKLNSSTISPKMQNTPASSEFSRSRDKWEIITESRKSSSRMQETTTGGRSWIHPIQLTSNYTTQHCSSRADGFISSSKYSKSKRGYTETNRRENSLNTPDSLPKQVFNFNSSISVKKKLMSNQNSHMKMINPAEKLVKVRLDKPPAGFNLSTTLNKEFFEHKMEEENNQLMKLKIEVGEGEITTLFAIDDRILTISFSSGDLIFYDLQKNQPICCIREHSTAISTMEVAYIKMKNPENGNFELKRILLTGGSEPENLVIAWDIDSLKPLKRLSGHSHLISSIRDLGDEATLATASFDSRVAFWDLREQFKCIQLLEEHDSPVLCLDYNVDDRYLCTGCLDGSIYIWALYFQHGVYQGCVLNQRLSVEGHVLEISRSISFPDVLITLESDHNIRLYSLKDKTFLKSFKYDQRQNYKFKNGKFLDFVLVERNDQLPLLFTIDEYNQVSRFDDWNSEPESQFSDDRLSKENASMINNLEFVKQSFAYRPKSQVIIQGMGLVIVSISGQNELVLQNLDVN